MKALKGLLIYIGIVLGSIVGLGLILFCIMYFFPSVRIMGVSVVHYQKETEESTITLDDYSDYDDVIVSISSKTIGVSVIPVEEENIKYSMKLSVFGMSTEIVEYKLNKQVNVKDGKLQIFLNVTEPNGLINNSNSKVVVKIPSSLEVGIVTNSTKGDIVIGGSDLRLKLSSLSVTTDNGDLSLVNIGTGEEEKSLTLQSLTLSTARGNFDLSQITNLNVLKKIKLNAQDGDFKFNNVFASIDITGSGVRIDANKIVCGNDGFKAIAENGYFNVKSLSSSNGIENTIIVENIDLKIDEITGKTGIVTTYGDVNIGILNSYSIIDNENGNVKVSKAKDSIIVTTNMGNINVDSYSKSGKFQSNKGDISVKSIGDYIQDCTTTIINVDGKVYVDNKINQLYVKTTGRSHVQVIFREIKENFDTANGEKIIQHRVYTSTKGSCVVDIPTAKTVAFAFIAEGSISGELSSLQNDVDNSMYVYSSEKTQYYPNSGTTVVNDALDNAHFHFKGKIQIRSYS